MNTSCQVQRRRSSDNIFHRTAYSRQRALLDRRLFRRHTGLASGNHFGTYRPILLSHGIEPSHVLLEGIELVMEQQ